MGMATVLRVRVSLASQGMEPGEAFSASCSHSWAKAARRQDVRRDPTGGHKRFRHPPFARQTKGHPREAELRGIAEERRRPDQEHDRHGNELHLPRRYSPGAFVYREPTSPPTGTKAASSSARRMLHGRIDRRGISHTSHSTATAPKNGLLHTSPPCDQPPAPSPVLPSGVPRSRMAFGRLTTVAE